MNKVEAHRQKMMGLVEEWQKSGQLQKTFAQAHKMMLGKGYLLINKNEPEKVRLKMKQKVEV